ncbi:MFS transporter [Nibricoccus sp. IMCC34717]|uniref:MFS transporter n=1 Tax=Nibricoccus sp. IMCC34717 TaxID=3034021 RepID=UPI00384AF204
MSVSQSPSKPRKTLSLRRTLKLSVIDGLVAMPIVTMSLPVNVFLAALFTKGLHLEKTHIGLITSLPFFCNFLQVFFSPFLSRRLSPRVTTVWFASFHCVTWAAVAVLLSFLPIHDPAAATRWLSFWFFASSLANAFAGIGWNQWVQELVPTRLRGKYFGRRNGLLSFSNTAFLLGAGWALETWQYSVGVFQVVIAVAVFLRLFSLRWLYLMPESPEPVRADRDLKAEIQTVKNSRSLLAFVAFGAVWSFSANVCGPFYHVFMFEKLELSALQISLLAVIAAFGGALSLPAWGQLLDRYGNKSVMAVSLLLWQVQNLFWCFLGPENRDWLYWMWLAGGTVSAGFVLGQFTLLLKLIPVEAKSLAIGVNLAVTSIVAAVAPITGGWLLTWALARWPDAEFTVYHIGFLAQPVIASLSAFILLGVHEPQARSFTSVVGAMRNIRTLSGIFGMSFLVNYVFYRDERKPRV